MTLRSAQSQSGLRIATRPAVTDQPGQGRVRRFWKDFLTALMQVMSAWTV
jgi:hypothetical protein